MRLWSLHPRYLDRQGLTACWREGLLAQAVLAGRTTGYRNHSQLIRFRAHPDPVAAVGAYLAAVAEEAAARGYRFDAARILAGDAGTVAPLPVTAGQLDFERAHLAAKLRARSPDLAAAFAAVAVPEPHPLFTVVPGPVEEWERGSGAGAGREAGARDAETGWEAGARDAETGWEAGAGAAGTRRENSARLRGSGPGRSLAR